MVDNYVLKLLKDSYKGGGDERGRYNDPRLHVSDLYKFCARNYAFAQRARVSFRRRLFVGQQLGYIFDMGNQIQEIFINRFAKTGLLFGTWECLNCGHKETRFQRDEPLCQHCESPALRYVDTELLLNYKGLALVASIDTLLRADMVRPIIFPNECKSIKKDGDDGFDKLKEPLRDHKYQVSLYQWVLRQPGVRILHKDKEEKVSVAKNTATISYAVKGNATPPFKVFKVEPDEEFIKATKKKLDQVVKFKADGRLPRRICDSQACYMARDCPSRTECFK